MTGASATAQGDVMASTMEPARTQAPPAGDLDWTAAGAEALALFQTLLRVDTTNPPGAERAAADVLAERLRAEGLEPVVVEPAPGRANLIARLKGDGSKAPLMIGGHLDVVPAQAEHWTHPPFAAEIHDGMVWGRGTVDMKNMVAMSAMVALLLRRTGAPLKRDVIFCAVADEECGCRYGSTYLVEHHPELVRAEYALGEAGGFSLHFGGVEYFPIQIAQKGLVWGRLRATGAPGHGSMPREDNAVVRLSEAVARLGRARLPQHVTEPVSQMIEGLAASQKLPLALALRALLDPRLAPMLLKVFPNKAVARAFAALLSNTASPTVLRAGASTNVIPGEATCEFDGRTLPGQTEADFLRELRAAVGDDVEIEVFDRGEPVSAPADSELYRCLADAIRRGAPDGRPVPYAVPGYTDARVHAGAHREGREAVVRGAQPRARRAHPRRRLPVGPARAVGRGAHVLLLTGASGGCAGRAGTQAGTPGPRDPARSAEFPADLRTQPARGSAASQPSTTPRRLE
jgi:acetylornithine deacetylase/succinyl-diaminopimelate desuccinylase-like protein